MATGLDFGLGKAGKCLGSTKQRGPKKESEDHF